MYQAKQKLERELAFTKVYRENLKEHKAIRESRCMATQLRTYFVPFREEDLIAGRISRPYVVFAPCLEGDGIDKVGYCIDERNCRAQLEQLQADPSCDQDYCKQIRDMIDFWSKENTNTKIRNRFPGEWEGSMGGDDYSADNAAMHPLYRLAGVNLDFKKLFRLGLPGLKQEALDYAQKAQDADKRTFYQAMTGIYDALQDVILSYRSEALAQMESAKPERQKELQEMADSLEAIASNPPSTMQEALQLQTIYMLGSRSVEIGRIDDYLGEFYKKDLKAGRITKEKAIRLVNNFFSIIETQCGRDTRVIIGGMGREHERSADEFALLVMDVLDVRRDHFYPQISLRCYREMNPALYDRALSILAEGCTFPMLYNDDVNVASVMRAMDVPRKVAEQYSFFGCGEYMLACKSIGTPNTALNVAKILEIVLHDGVNPANGKACQLQTGRKVSEIQNFEELKSLVKEYLSFYIDISGGFEELLYDVCGEEACFLQYSALLDDCMARGKGMLNGGLAHLGGTVETYGNVTLEDSMTAIRDVVFKKKAVTLQELIGILDQNFEGHEPVQRMLLDAPKFGNDRADADDLAAELHEYICGTIRNQRNKTRMDSFLAVLINNNMNVSLGRFVGATPDGRKAGVFLSNGNSPYNGQDKEGLTALIHSMTRMDNSIHAGGNQNLKLSPRLFKGDRREIKSVLSTFFELGGQQVNLSVVNQKDLEDAMEHPERHENLVVRVGGYTARFIDLDKKTQQDVLTRTTY